MKIQERDREILRRCYEQQFLLVEHVERYFFHDGAWRRAYERIRELENAGLITKTGLPGFGAKRIIRLTKHGIAIAQQLHPIEIPQRRRLDFHTIEHDAIVTSVALRLHQLWDGIWVPERAIKKDDYAQIPDGVFMFETGNKVTIEVENSLKGRTRFLTLLDRWKHVPMRLILYVATHPRIYKSLKEYLSDGPGGIPFALVEWTALRDGSPTVWCPKGELNVFGRRFF
jgi:hypothetical protein